MWTGEQFHGARILLYARDLGGLLRSSGNRTAHESGPKARSAVLTTLVHEADDCIGLESSSGYKARCKVPSLSPEKGQGAWHNKEM